MNTRFQIMYNTIVLMVILMTTQEGVLSRTISSRNHESGAKHSELQENHHIETRGTKELLSGLQPFFVANFNTIYGGYSSKSLKLDKNRLSEVNIGTINFYKQDLYNYIKQGITPQSGIYGFAAHYENSVTSSDYTFFKSISNSKTEQNRQLQAKTLSTHSKRSEIESDFIQDDKDSKHSNQKREDDRVQCRNQSGDSILFSRGECLSAANKMTSEKTAMSTCGGCQLIMIGPQDQLSSSNMPASELQMHASSILDGCVTGTRDANNLNTLSNNVISKNSKPTFVLLLSQGFGPNCN